MKKRYLAPLAAALALLASGCETRLDRGEVVGKRHEPARTFIYMMPVRTGEVCSGGYGSQPRTCTPIYTHVPITQYDDEDWILVLKDGDKKGVAYVTPDVWEHIGIGEWWDKETDGGGRKDPSANVS